MKIKIRDGFYLSSTSFCDKAAYLKHLNEDQKISEAIPVIPYPYKESDADWWIQHRLDFVKENEREISFAIRDINDYLIGSIGIDNCQIGKTHKAEVGYWLAKAYRNPNLMSDALSTFIEYVFVNLDLTRLTARTLVFNQASARVLEKNKFKLEGCLRQDTRTKNGIFDTLIWGLLKDDWQKCN